MWMDVCPCEVMWALRGSFLEGIATQLFEVNIMIHVVVLLTVHTYKYNNPKGSQSQNWINEYLRIPDAKNTPEISFFS